MGVLFVLEMPVCLVMRILIGIQAEIFAALKMQDSSLTAMEVARLVQTFSVAAKAVCITVSQQKYLVQNVMTKATSS
jgi:hypothetical protein